MPIIGTFNGMNIVGLPSDTMPSVRGPSSIEWTEQEVVASNVSPFTGQMQTFDWQASWWEAMVSFAPMQRLTHDAWSAFLSQLRGESNAFLIGDPKAKLPKGSAMPEPPTGGLDLFGGPVIDGAGQSGYSVNTRRWIANQTRLLMPGDFIQIGYRLHKILDPASSNSSGHATLAIWPPLRDNPGDGQVFVTRACKGLFKLKNNGGFKRSTNPGNYGISGFAIREAI